LETLEFVQPPLVKLARPFGVGQERAAHGDKVEFRNIRIKVLP